MPTIKVELFFTCIPPFWTLINLIITSYSRTNERILGKAVDLGKHTRNAFELES